MRKSPQRWGNPLVPQGGEPASQDSSLLIDWIHVFGAAGGRGIAVASTYVMITKIRPSTSPDSELLLRWIFERDARALTCELDIRGDRGYDVSVVPHWDVSSSLIERFDAPGGAWLRHAEIARRLRESGWVLTDHVSADHAAAAA